MVEWMELCVPSFLLLWVFCRSGLHCYGQRAVSIDTLSVVPSVPPPLCDPIHLPLDEQCVEFSGILLYSAAAPLLGYGCLNGYRLNTRDRSSFSLHHVSDITPRLQILRDLETDCFGLLFFKMPFLHLGG